jgi:predicted AAA+ superfamily ATPase
VKNYISLNIGNITSVNNIRNVFKQKNILIRNEVLSEYLDSFINCFYISEVKRFEILGKNILQTLPKYYIIDHSFRNLQFPDIKEKFGFLLENLVYSELIRREYIVYIGKSNSNEIDFVAIKDSEELHIQVCDVITNINEEREISPLIKRAYNVKSLLIHYGSEEKVDKFGIK